MEQFFESLGRMSRETQQQTRTPGIVPEQQPQTAQQPQQPQDTQTAQAPESLITPEMIQSYQQMAGQPMSLGQRVGLAAIAMNDPRLAAQMASDFQANRQGALQQLQQLEQAALERASEGTGVDPVYLRGLMEDVRELGKDPSEYLQPDGSIDIAGLEQAASTGFEEKRQAEEVQALREQADKTGAYYGDLNLGSDQGREELQNRMHNQRVLDQADSRTIREEAKQNPEVYLQLKNQLRGPEAERVGTVLDAKYESARVQQKREIAAEQRRAESHQSDIQTQQNLRDYRERRQQAMDLEDVDRMNTLVRDIDRSIASLQGRLEQAARTLTLSTQIGDESATAEAQARLNALEVQLDSLRRERELAQEDAAKIRSNLLGGDEDPQAERMQDDLAATGALRSVLDARSPDEQGISVGQWKFVADPKNWEQPEFTDIIESAWIRYQNTAETGNEDAFLQSLQKLLNDRYQAIWGSPWVFETTPTVEALQESLGQSQQQPQQQSPQQSTQSTQQNELSRNEIIYGKPGEQ
jgi:hypothetical protein